MRCGTRLTGALVAATAALTLGAPAHAAFPGSNGVIAFMCGKDAHREGGQVYPEGICTVRPDGTGLRRLDPDPVRFIASPGGDAWPAVSPDGRQIAWTRFVSKAGQSHGHPELFVMDLDGGNVRQITHTESGATMPSWAPDGQRLAFEGGGLSEVWLDGTGMRTLEREASRPAWSPGGTHIAFDTWRDRLWDCPFRSPTCDPANQLYVMRADGSEERALTRDGDRSFNAPNWSADGTQIAVGCDERVCRIGADGDGLTELLSQGTRPAWAPDGSGLAFGLRTYGQGSRAEIRVAAADGTGVRTIAEGEDPDWGPEPGTTPPLPPPPERPAPPPPPPAPEPPWGEPRLTVIGAGRVSLPRALRRGLSFAVTSSAPATVAARLTWGRRPLGGTIHFVPANTETRIRVRLARRWRARLRTARRPVRAVLRLAATTSTGESSALSRRVTLVP